MENMNGVMTGIIEVKLASHGALDELVESPPFQGGIYGFKPHTHHHYGRVVEWSITPDCKSGAFGLRWFKSNLSHQYCGVEQRLAQRPHKP